MKRIPKLRKLWLHIKGIGLYFVIIGIMTASHGTGLHAQFQYDNQWIFNFENDTATILDFRFDMLQIAKAVQSLKIDQTNTVISDYWGNLALYSNGCEVYDSSFAMMLNGNGLNPGTVADANCQYGYVSIHQSMVSLPSPTNDSLFHIFHKRIITDFSMNPIALTDSLFHTIVNINGSNGLGEVIQKNRGINTNILGNGHLNAVKRKGKDSWWIISAVRDNDEIEIYELESDGISSVTIEALGDDIPEIAADLQTVFNPNGDLFVRAFADIGIYLYDFDRETGTFFNPRHIPFTIEPKFGGVAISANGRFLYVNSLIEIWQFDLEADDIEASKTLIATYDGYQSPFSTTFYNAQIGPDCKIYYNSPSGVDVLHVMHNPNVKGTACNFEQHGIQLLASHGSSLPYFPSYRLDTDYPVCDTTKLVATSINIPIKPSIQIWAAAPNPTEGIFYLATNKIVKDEVQVFIYGSWGRLIMNKRMPVGEKSIQFDLTGQGSGVYFYQVIGANGVTASGRVMKY